MGLPACLSFPFDVKVLLNGDFNFEVSRNFHGGLLCLGLALLISQVCLGSFVNDWQARGDATPSGLISWAEICILLQKPGLGWAGREQRGSSFSRDSPQGQAFELTTEAFPPLSLCFFKPLPHLSPHTTRLVNCSKGLSEHAGRRKGLFFFPSSKKIQSSLQLLWRIGEGTGCLKTPLKHFSN